MPVPLIVPVLFGARVGPPMVAGVVPGLREFLNCCPLTATTSVVRTGRVRLFAILAAPATSLPELGEWEFMTVFDVQRSGLRRVCFEGFALIRLARLRE
jgi:hypothetical protein